MKFEVLNDKGKIVMTTTSVVCIPEKELIGQMINAGYKLRLNNKIISKKKLEEFLCGLTS